MTKKLRELLEKRNAKLLAIKEHAKTLTTDSSFDAKAYDAKLELLDTELKGLDRAIKTEELASTPSAEVDIIVQEENKFKNMENVTARPEYKTAYFEYLQGKHTLADLEAKFGSSASNSMGASIPETTMNEIIDKLEQRSALLKVSRIENIKGTLRIAVEQTNDGANLHVEGDVIDEENLTLVERVWNQYEIAKLVSISKTVATQSISALESFIIDEISRKLAVKIEELMATGTGSSQPTGYLVDTNITNEKKLDELTYATILEIIAALPTMYHNNAQFLMSRTTYFKNIVGLVDNTGQPIFKLGTAEGKPNFTILGYNVQIVDQFPDWDSAITDDKVFIFGDCDYYLANFGMDATIDKSMESSFRKGLVDYRGMVIFDSKVLDGTGFVRVVKNVVV
jgi:HK97 family phage major capsid protein